MTGAGRYSLAIPGARFYVSRGSGGRRNHRTMEIVEVVGPVVLKLNFADVYQVEVRTVRAWRTGRPPIGHIRAINPSRLVPVDRVDR